jgi:hypothetical protein
MEKQSGVYLIYLGDFKNLKNKLSILNSPTFKYRSFNDDDGIYKFGKTKNLSQRINQHKIRYEKVLGQKSIYENFRLVCFRELNEKEITSAEKSIREFCLDRNFHFIEESKDKDAKFNELVIIRNCDVCKMESFYNSL